VGTGVKIYNWLFTMFGGRVRFATPMLWSLGFLVTFVIGGMTGVLLAVPPADFVLHNSLFLVAHFHNVIISGVIFGAFAGYTYWFPKAFGFRLDERWGKIAFWLTIIGFCFTFAPLYMAGLLGMTRRMQSYDVPDWQPWILMASAGMVIVTLGVIAQIVQLVVSIRHRNELRDETGDPWDGRSLEWATPSPPPPFNFAVLPHVEGEEAYWAIKQRAREQNELRLEPDYQELEMPRNTPTGFICAFFSTIVGFAMIWDIWWLAGVGIAGAFATFVVFAWRDIPEYIISGTNVARIDRANRTTRLDALATYTGPRP
jgi:cytochrome o ubiquinol oxidase subunit 1